MSPFGGQRGLRVWAGRVCTSGGVPGAGGTLAAMGMSVRFEIFPADLDAAVDFYVRVLGFRLVVDQRGGPEAYVAFERDRARIGAAQRDQSVRVWRRPPTGVEIVLEVDDVAAELGRVVAAGWPIEEALVRRPWGLDDFRIVDPDGYYLRLTNRRPAA